MSLSTTEKAQLAEIVGLPKPDMVAAELATIAGTDQETILKADIARFQVIRGKYGSLVPTAKSGVVFSPAEERGDIKRRIILMLDIADVVNRFAGYNGSGNTIRRA